MLRTDTSAEAARTVAWRTRPTRRELALGTLLVFGSQFPLFELAPWKAGGSSFVAGDAGSHARVAYELARFGLPHGWIESYLGGFPFGHHYPPLGWLLLAIGIRGGLAPIVAINWLGFIATLATPLTLFAACLRAGARPALAATGGCFLALVTPYNPFVGGLEVYFSSGLLSQTLALPLCLAFAAAVARGARAEGVLCGAFAMLAHPELSAATASIVAVVALLHGVPGRRAAAGCALAAVGVAGLALYGQGILTLGVPLGWPPGFDWRQLGFGTARLAWWFRDGDLLDYGATTPQLTSLSLAAVLACALLFKRPAARAALSLVLAGIVASSSGPTLARLPLGGLLLEFFQPLRVIALLPAIFALVLVVALEEGSAALRRVGFSMRWRRFELVALLPVATAFGALAFALPLRVRATNELVAIRASKAAALCNTVPGFEPRVLAGWLEQLQGGSLWFDERATTPLIGCVGVNGLELRSGVPIATTSSVGAHVGVLWAAGRQLQPERAGFARRAEALGVRYVLQMKQPNATVPAGFVRHRSRGQVELLELASGARAHVGCVRERWNGSDQALRLRLTHDLAEPAGADKLLDPERLIELRTTSGDVQTENVLSDCDSTQAMLELVPREPGAIEAEVSSHAPVDVAFHATAFPSWRVSVDGAPGTAPRMIAPGYFYVHLAAGHHRLLATAGSMPGYAGWLLAAVLAIAGLAWLDARRLVVRIRRRS